MRTGLVRGWCQRTTTFSNALLKQADLDRGGVYNLAIVWGQGPVREYDQSRSSIEADGSSWVSLPQQPSIAVRFPVVKVSFL